MHTENQDTLRKYFTLLKKTYNINTDNLEQVDSGDSKKLLVTVKLTEIEDVKKVLQSIKWMNADGSINSQDEGINELLLNSPEARRAYLRGAYMAIGSMSDPTKGYHLEFVCLLEEQAKQLCQVLTDFELDAKIVRRKKYEVVYIKEGSAIVDLLNIIEAHVALMNFENLRIEKEIRNSVNRRVNCETANITKTVNASGKQIDDIIIVRDKYGFDNLPDNLRETAVLRLEYPDATLKELGELLCPAVGKSGMNHRLRKLSEIADRYRDIF